MTEGWAYSGSPHSRAADGTMTLVEGVTFCICDTGGDIGPGAERGLFFRDTRFLSRFEVEIDGERLDPLTVNCPNRYTGIFIARRPPRSGAADSTLLVVRRRYVGNGMMEEITLRNLGGENAGVILSLTVEADFAGLFEVKEDRVRVREATERVTDNGALRLIYRQGTESRAVTVAGTAGPTVTSQQLIWRPVLPPRSEWTATVQVLPALDGVDVPPRYRPGQPVEASGPAARLAEWRQATPAVSTPDARLNAMLAVSAEDLGALRIFDGDRPDRSVVAAGAPWFMTLFGRDALLTSWMLLPLDPSLALGTLHTLARLQGSKVDPLSEEEPGRILHEVRSGLDGGYALGGRDVYYGSSDATPLFVMLLGELRRWGLARGEVDALLPHADRALAWIEQFGDSDGDGFVEYQRATDRGLANQGWKDSFDAISFAGGALAEPPIALAEVQGYVYAAYVARAHFAREAGEEDVAGHWTEAAAALKRRFNDAFWLPDRGYYALALDRDKRPVDALASNMGHCLWTGVVDEDKAAAVVGRAARAGHVHRVRGAHARRDDEPLQPDELPQWLGLAARQRHPRGRPDAVRRRGRRPAGRYGRLRRRRELSAAGCPSCFAVSTAPSSASRCPIRRPAHRRPGPPRPRCTCCAPCCVSTHGSRSAGCGARRPSRNATCRYGSRGCTWPAPLSPWTREREPGTSAGCPAASS